MSDNQVFSFEVRRVANGSVVQCKDKNNYTEVYVTTGDPTPGQLIDAFIAGQLLNPSPAPAKVAPAKAPSGAAISAGQFAKVFAQSTIHPSLEKAINDLTR